MESNNKQQPIQNSKKMQGTRIDSFGNPILKGQKMHRITFSDDIINNGNQLKKIVLVDCWKELNINEDRQQQKNQCCQLF